MLRITVTETAVEERWILQGQLSEALGRRVGFQLESLRGPATVPVSHR